MTALVGLVQPGDFAVLAGDRYGLPSGPGAAPVDDREKVHRLERGWAAITGLDQARSYLSALEGLDARDVWSVARRLRAEHAGDAERDEAMRASWTPAERDEHDSRLRPEGHWRDVSVLVLDDRLQTITRINQDGPFQTSESHMTSPPDVPSADLHATFQAMLAPLRRRPPTLTDWARRVAWGLAEISDRSEWVGPDITLAWIVIRRGRPRLARIVVSARGFAEAPELAVRATMTAGPIVGVQRLPLAGGIAAALLWQLLG